MAGQEAVALGPDELLAGGEILPADFVVVAAGVAIAVAGVVAGVVIAATAATAGSFSFSPNLR